MEDNLLVYRGNVTSEHGEDGIISRIFDVLGPGMRWCVDLGALNGTHGSNVWQLIKKQGWKGVLIEADKTYFEKLVQEFTDTPNVYCVNAFVSFEGPQSLDVLLSCTPLPREFDLFSLDVDGAEYHLWDSMNDYRPRVMVVEFNPSIPNNVSFVQSRDMSVFQGSSLRALVELGEKKGYELVATTEGNAFFVLRELYPRFNIADNSLDALHTDHRFETNLFQLYDGTLKIAGNTRLMWHNVPIDEEKLQVLTRRQRHYPARISGKAIVRRAKFFVRRLPFYSAVQAFRRYLRGGGRAG